MQSFNLSDGLIIANVGTLIGLLGGLIKLIWWLSKADSRIDDAKASAIRAHKRINKLSGDRTSDECE